jgi:hypothetical protein
MTGTARVTPAILEALALAPMDLEALLHEIGCTKRGLLNALAHLQTQGRIDRDERGCYRLSLPAAPAEPPPVEAVPAAAPPTAGSATQVERTDAGWRALGPTTATPAIGTADLVLQVLIAAGRITDVDIRRATALIGARP